VLAGTAVVCRLGEGLACIAVPIRDYRGETIAAVSMAGPVARLVPYEARFGCLFAATTLQISTALRDLGFWII
jgi:DNA-binding IclR family transcriptional regulator